MAHNKSAKKRILQTAVRTERNRYYRTRIKNITKAVH
ncbi:MAG: 30S ribosomal protein S20, partial [Sulfurovum sp.]|nr:30S ribosomal protein S20 [Sulfurovum sp.]NNJ46136.1 30S ribosomal protein S20 [Sulfurovum sp.]